MGSLAAGVVADSRGLCIITDGPRLWLVSNQYAVLIGVLSGQFVADVRSADEFGFGNLGLILIIGQVHSETRKVIIARVLEVVVVEGPSLAGPVGLVIRLEYLGSEVFTAPNRLRKPAVECIQVDGVLDLRC